VVLPALVHQLLDGEQVADEPVVGHRPPRGVVTERYLVVGMCAEDLGRRHDNHVPHTRGRRGKGQRPPGAQQRKTPLGGAVGERLGQVGARGDPDEDVDTGQLRSDPRARRVDHPPADALDRTANRREDPDLRHAVRTPALGGQEPRDPQRRHPDDLTGADNRDHGHTRRRRFALGGTDGGTQRVLLVVV
jgi:hypothetical protein